MLNVRFLGTLSGTEPFPDMHHSSWILQVGGRNYWFDAGENCTHTAVTTGVDIMDTVALFISHAHIDHIGGMPNLLNCFRKFNIMHNRQLLNDNTLQLFFPDFSRLDAIKELAALKTPNTLPYTLAENTMQDGLLFEDELVKVTALHNTHLKEDGSNGWHSFSFLIESDGKRIVYSGDVGKPEEVDELIGDGCDVLIMETGHHLPEDVCQYALSHNVKHLRLTHHGRAIINNRSYYQDFVKSFSNDNPIDVRLCYDGLIEEF